MPTDFNGWSALVVRWLSFVEEISPFKVGEMQKVIAEASKDSYVPPPCLDVGLGLAHAPAGGHALPLKCMLRVALALPLLRALSVLGNARRLPELGNQIAPYFAVAQIIFLLAFVAYFTLGVVALIHDYEAMDCECAEDSWIWLYALLVVVIPTSLGTIRAWAGRDALADG